MERDSPRHALAYYTMALCEMGFCDTYEPKDELMTALSRFVILQVLLGSKELSF